MNIVVFDKTGTITRGLPSVTDLEILLDKVEDVETVLPSLIEDLLSDLSSRECTPSCPIDRARLPLLYLAGSAERSNEHSLAKSVVKETVVNTATNDYDAIVVVAAGNYQRDGCIYSPGRAATSFNVGSHDLDDGISYFSNFGSCVDPCTSRGEYSDEVVKEAEAAAVKVEAVDFPEVDADRKDATTLRDAVAEEVLVPTVGAPTTGGRV